LGVPSVVALHLYKGGGLDPLQTDFQVNPAVLGNKSHEKLGTLTDSAHARTVREALFGFQQHVLTLLYLELDIEPAQLVKEPNSRINSTQLV
jgi:hypothetical protein